MIFNKNFDLSNVTNIGPFNLILVDLNKINSYDLELNKYDNLLKNDYQSNINDFKNNSRKNQFIKILGNLDLMNIFLEKMVKIEPFILKSISISALKIIDKSFSNKSFLKKDFSNLNKNDEWAKKYNKFRKNDNCNSINPINSFFANNSFMSNNNLLKSNIEIINKENTLTKNRIGNYFHSSHLIDRGVSNNFFINSNNNNFNKSRLGFKISNCFKSQSKINKENLLFNKYLLIIKDSSNFRGQKFVKISPKNKTKQDKQLNYNNLKVIKPVTQKADDIKKYENYDHDFFTSTNCNYNHFHERIDLKRNENKINFNQNNIFINNLNSNRSKAADKLKSISSLPNNLLRRDNYQSHWKNFEEKKTKKFISNQNKNSIYSLSCLDNNLQGKNYPKANNSNFIKSNIKCDSNNLDVFKDNEKSMSKFSLPLIEFKNNYNLNTLVNDRNFQSFDSKFFENSKHSNSYDETIKFINKISSLDIDIKVIQVK